MNTLTQLKQMRNQLDLIIRSMESPQQVESTKSRITGKLSLKSKAAPQTNTQPGKISSDPHKRAKQHARALKRREELLVEVVSQPELQSKLDWYVGFIADLEAYNDN